MRAASIIRKLRELDVPLDKAKAAAEQFGDESGIPAPTAELEKTIRRAARKKTALQEQRKFRLWCTSNGLPVPVAEHKFHGKRFWRFDFAFPDTHEGAQGGVAVEVEGGVFSRGRHVRPKGYLGDVAKYNAAVELGWRVVRVTPQTLYTDGTLETLRSLLLTPTQAVA